MTMTQTRKQWLWMHSYGTYAFECSLIQKRATWIGYIFWFRWDIYHFFKSLPCKFLGHNYYVSGHGGPNTGYDEATCTRCGHYWKHIYY